MRRLSGVLGLAAALTATACGGSGSGAGSATTTSAPPSTVTSTPAMSASPASTRGTATAGPCGWRTTTTYRHVLWLWMENRTYSAVLGSDASAPHLRSYASGCGLATAYAAVTHPSLPNYLAATSGSTGGVSSDCSPTSCPQGRASLFGQLQAAGKTWRSYEEGMPGSCALSGSGGYAPKHNPAAYFLPVRSQCRTWDVPMGGSTGALATALATRTLPSFALITPDLCHDGHDCPTVLADGWLGTWLGRITSSPAYRAGDTVLFVTCDEGVGSDQRIATVVIAPTVPRGLRVATPFTHYSLLRTTEELLGLGKIGAAAQARSMRAAFRL